MHPQQDTSLGLDKRAETRPIPASPTLVTCRPQLPVPRGTFREDVVFFPSRERLRGCESWQNAQSSCLLGKGAVTSDQVSCVPLFLHCGEGGICQPGPGAAPPYPVVPTKLPSFPLSPAWQSIYCLPAGTGALSWDKNSHVCLPMDQGWQEVKTSLCSSAGLATSIAGSTPRKVKLVSELGHGSRSAPNVLPWDSAGPQGQPRKRGQARGGEVVAGRMRRPGSSRMDKPRSAGDLWVGQAPVLLVRLSGGATARAVPGVSLQPVTAGSVHWPQGGLGECV